MYYEYPARNRYYSGVFLEKTGAGGAFPYVYQAFHTVDPFITDTRQRTGGNRKDVIFKNFMM